MCFSWTVIPYSGISAAGDVHSHPNTMTKHNSPNVNVTSTTALTTAGPICMGDISGRYISPHLTPHISWLLNRPETSTPSEHANLDASQGMFIRITAVSINFSKRIFEIRITKKAVMETHLMSATVLEQY